MPDERSHALGWFLKADSDRLTLRHLLAERSAS